MEHRHHYWFEKLILQLTVAAAICVVYFFVASSVIPSDPLSPIEFNSPGAFLKYAMLVGFFSAILGIISVPVRPESALLACVIGIGGFCLRTNSAAALLWAKQNELSSMFMSQAAEVILLAIVLIPAVFIILIFRSATARIFPRCKWENPLEGLTSQQRKLLSKSAYAKDKKKPKPLPASIVKMLWSKFIRKETTPSAAEFFSRKNIISALACLTVSCVLGIFLTMITLRTALRGQILFSLFVSFMLSAMLSFDFFGTSWGFACWIAPIPAAVFFYVLAAVQSAANVPQPWMDVKPFGYILPIDWISAGLGGALLGYWITLRMRQATILEQLQEEESV